MWENIRVEEGRLLYKEFYDLGKVTSDDTIHLDWKTDDLVRIGVEENFYTRPLYGTVTSFDSFVDNTADEKRPYLQAIEHPLALAFILPSDEQALAFFAQGGGLELICTPMNYTTPEELIKRSAHHVFSGQAQVQHKAIGFSHPINIDYERHLLKKKAKQRVTSPTERARCKFYYDALQQYE